MTEQHRPSGVDRKRRRSSLDFTDEDWEEILNWMRNSREDGSDSGIMSTFERETLEKLIDSLPTRRTTRRKAFLNEQEAAKSRNEATVMDLVRSIPQNDVADPNRELNNRTKKSLQNEEIPRNRVWQILNSFTIKEAFPLSTLMNWMMQTIVRIFASPFAWPEMEQLLASWPERTMMEESPSQNDSNIILQGKNKKEEDLVQDQHCNPTPPPQSIECNSSPSSNHTPKPPVLFMLCGMEQFASRWSNTTTDNTATNSFLLNEKEEDHDDGCRPKKGAACKSHEPSAAKNGGNDENSVVSLETLETHIISKFSAGDHSDMSWSME
ncbi:unnamed protein product [Cylindrotheca closterium]|uniref:Uncharacterized protein n=1 Tax=Cylindrotheca closterium TaxID=2856 RepID=A0AAD2FJ79_9STRA|nr:unnamed protein product [Cylindrotheca closterium]